MVSYSNIIIVSIALQMDIFQDNGTVMTAQETMQIFSYY